MKGKESDNISQFYRILLPSRKVSDIKVQLENPEFQKFCLETDLRSERFAEIKEKEKKSTKKRKSETNEETTKRKSKSKTNPKPSKKPKLITPEKEQQSTLTLDLTEEPVVGDKEQGLEQESEGLKLPVYIQPKKQKREPEEGKLHIEIFPNRKNKGVAETQKKENFDSFWKQQ